MLQIPSALLIMYSHIALWHIYKTPRRFDDQITASTSRTLHNIVDGFSLYDTDYLVDRHTAQMT